jgi:hypothetical protein
MTAKGTRRLSGVNVNDYKALIDQIHIAAYYSPDRDIASGRLYTQLKAAITSAKKPGNEGYGNSSTGDVMSVAILDEKLKTLIDAEFYIRHAEYRDEEAFKR